ncbi:MAG: flagellar biosynthesis anti-sigma factor FlgM [Thermodesulfobacteriota bacterium]
MKIHPGQVIKQFESIQKKQPVDKPQQADKAKEGDKVVFSETLQQAKGTQGDLSVDAERQERIQTVKEQIANGTYAPDSQKVAASLWKYIAEGRANG